MVSPTHHRGDIIRWLTQPMVGYYGWHGMNMKYILGVPSKIIFGKTWDFGPTKGTPQPLPKVGPPKKEKKV